MSEFGRMSIAPDGELVVNLVRHDRTDHPDEGLTNPANMGFVPTEMLLMRSADCGHTWSEPAPIEPPLVGPLRALLAGHVLRDGRWLLPTSTWMDWEGNLPNGNRMVAFVSADRGRTWPGYLDVMHSPDDNLIFWESKIVELSDGRLLAVAWCLRPPGQRRSAQPVCDQPRRRGHLVAAAVDGIAGPDAHALPASRRPRALRLPPHGPAGPWAVVSHLEGDRWVNDGYQPLWGHRSAAGQTALEENMVDTFHGLKFGAPRSSAFPTATSSSPSGATSRTSASSAGSTLLALERLDLGRERDLTRAAALRWMTCLAADGPTAWRPCGVPSRPDRRCRPRRPRAPSCTRCGWPSSRSGSARGGRGFASVVSLRS